MLTRRIDAALDALCACRDRAPFLRDVFRPGTPERDALEVILDGLKQFDDAKVVGCEPPAP